MESPLCDTTSPPSEGLTNHDTLTNSRTQEEAHTETKSLTTELLDQLVSGC
jgi:hypothetical protein